MLSHVENGLGSVTFFGYWNISTGDSSRNSISVYALGLPLLKLCGHHLKKYSPVQSFENEWLLGKRSLASPDVPAESSPSQASREIGCICACSQSFRTSIQPTHTIMKNFKRCLKPCFRVVCYTAIDNWYTMPFISKIMSNYSSMKMLFFVTHPLLYKCCFLCS